MGQKQAKGRAADVGDPLHVQHTAHLKLDPLRGIVLQVPELDEFLLKEGVPYSDRHTWEVMRFVYQAGGFDLVKDTLQLVQGHRVKEPTPDYDLTTTSTTATPTSQSSTATSTPSLDRRRTGSGKEREVIHRDWSSSSESPRETTTTTEVLRIRSSVKVETVSPGRPPQSPVSDAVSDDWLSARSSFQEAPEVTVKWLRSSQPDEPTPDFVRPASKMWKRPMSPEVHADLVRVLKARESQDDKLQELQELEIKRTHTILFTDADMNG